MLANSPTSFVILASGTGTNARALLQRAKEKPELLAIKALVSDRPNVPALAVANEFGVPAHVIAHGEEKTLLELLKSVKAQWACLAGYKKIVGKNFLEFFASPEGFFRVLNVHPSLLPAYPGLNAYVRAFQDNVAKSGVTVHLVDQGVDTGPIVLQESFVREKNDTLESFEAKGRALELRLFPQAMELAAAGKIRIGEKA